MKSKKIFYSEAAFIWGIILLALGTAFMTKANFGLSMVVAPAYIVSVKIAEVIPTFTFGMAEYCLQAALLAMLCTFLKKFRPAYLLSFVTAVIYGIVLDVAISFVSFIPYSGITTRIGCFAAGVLLCSAGVAFMLRTYFPPEVYELIVKEVSNKFGFDVGKVKTAYDTASLILAIVLSFACFGPWQFEGIGVGTLICTVVNGFLIGKCAKLYDSIFDFKDALRPSCAIKTKK